MIYFPGEVLEHVFTFLTSQRDRNSVSLVCKSWFKIERFSRERIFIGNCYATSPERVVARFPRLKAVIIKGKPHFADFNLVPHDWGGFVLPWIESLAKNCPDLEELRLKRMIVSDECLDIVSRAFLNFKSLVLVSCEGFSTDGLASMAANCRFLEELELQEIEMEDTRGEWLSCFPESFTSLVSLNFACLKGEVSSSSLERLVSRSPNLRSLKLNRSVDTETLQRILVSSPELVDLGIGSFLHDSNSEAQTKLKSTFQKCKFIKSLSGFLDVWSRSLPAVYPICSGLTSLNLSYASGLETKELIRLIRHCRKLRKLQVLDFIGDKGLRAVASFCKDVEELRVFPSDPFEGSCRVTEEGLVAVSSGCHKLHSLLYFCSQMTNEALIKVAENCPHFTRFRLCILTPRKPDPITHGPLDEGFGAVVRSCRNLRRLSLSGLLTDRVFLYIGTHAERLEMLSVAFAGESDKGMLYVLNGCRRLRKLEIRDSPFGDGALLWNVGKFEAMRSLWMSSCEISFGGCKDVARRMPGLNVEIINENDAVEICDVGEMKVDKLYLYRTLSGPRWDAPSYVWTL